MGKPYTQQQKEAAFDLYYAMETERNLVTLCERLVNVANFVDRSPSLCTLQMWSRKDNWQARIKERDQKNAKKVQAKTDREIVKKHRELINTKADYRKDIRLALQPVKAAINKVIVKNEKTGELELNIGVENAKDLASIVISFEKLVKLDLGLIDDNSDSHWRKVRAKVLARDNQACVDCGSTEELQAHHLTYEREGRELPEDLITLCRDCHDKQPKRARLNIQLEGAGLDNLFDAAAKLYNRDDPEESDS